MRLTAIHIVLNMIHLYLSFLAFYLNENDYPPTSQPTNRKTTFHQFDQRSIFRIEDGILYGPHLILS